MQPTESTGQAGTAPSWRGALRAVALFVAMTAGVGGVWLLLWTAGYPYRDITQGIAQLLGIAGVVSGIVLLAVAISLGGPIVGAVSVWPRVAVVVTIAGAGAVTGWGMAEGLVRAATSEAPVDPRAGVAPAPASPAPRSATPQPPEGCEPDAAMGDVDGDGTPDRVAHQYVDPFPVVQVCFDDGTTASHRGLGMGERLELLDLDDDGRVEVVYGATAAGAEWVRMVVWHDHALTAVTTGDGQALELARGGTGRFQDEVWWTQETWGCADRDGDGRTELVAGRAHRTDDAYQATVVGYTIEGARAVVTSQSETELPLTSDPFDETDIRPCRDPRPSRL